MLLLSKSQRQLSCGCRKEELETSAGTQSEVEEIGKLFVSRGAADKISLSILSQPEAEELESKVSAGF